MGRWGRGELEAAHDRYVAVANACAASGDWGPWSELFTDDVCYVEHLFGRFEGREAVYRWITDTMGSWPNRAMTAFPHDWCICDEERGWWVCQIENRFCDPGDGQLYQTPNITILRYGGDMRFCGEEDVYNPAAFATLVKSWTDAYRRHHPGEAS